MGRAAKPFPQAPFKTQTGAHNAHNHKENMDTIFNSMTDVESYIADQPLDSPELYQENYAEIVADGFKKFLDQRNYKWGDKLPEISENEFWELFKAAELQEPIVNSLDKNKD